MAGPPMPAAVHLIARLAAGGMRDAESMLDQLLSAAPERIDEATVRDLLGLADAEVVDGFVDAPASAATARPGVALLDDARRTRPRLRALLDQAVDAIRAELMAGLADPAAVRHEPAALADAARRLAAIDPNRAGIGGLRFQLELALFAPDRVVEPRCSVADGRRGRVPGPPSDRPRSRRRRVTRPPPSDPATATRATPTPTRPRRQAPAATEAAAAAPAPTPRATATQPTPTPAPTTSAPEARPHRRRRPARGTRRARTAAATHAGRRAPTPPPNARRPAGPPQPPRTRSSSSCSRPGRPSSPS